MTENILKKIKLEENNIIEHLSEPNDEIEFLEDFLVENNFQSILNLLNTDIGDLMIAYISSENTELSFDYIKSIIETNKKQINSYSTPESLSFIATIDKIDSLVRSYPYDDIINALENDKNSNIQSFQKEIKFLKNLNNKVNVKGIIDLFTTSSQIMDECMNIVCFYKTIKKDYKNFNMTKNILEKDSSIKVKEKNFTNSFKKYLAFNYDLTVIQTILHKISNSISKKIKENQVEEKKLKKELKNYNTIELWLVSCENKKEYINIPIELTKIQNESLAHEILRNVYIHNQVYYNEIKEKYNELLKNSYNRFKKLFNSYNINIDDYNICFNESIDIISKKLEILKNIDIKDKNIFINIIKQASLENIESIGSLYLDGYITNEFVENNNKIFTSKYNNFIENINLLKKNNLSQNLIVKLNDNLNTDNAILNNNIHILKNYHLLKYLKHSENYLFLNETNLNSKIDIILELGLEDYLKNDIGLLNKETKLFNRILILKNLNIEITDHKDLNQYLETNNFIINDENINDYIFDISPFLEFDENDKNNKNEFLNMLNEKDEKISKRVYSFNGILISKNKVKNNINNIDSNELTKKQQFDCLISNKNLSQEEFDNLYNSLHDKKYEYIKK